MELKHLIFCLIAIGLFPLTGCTQKKDIGDGEAKLVWSDEFDYHGLPDSTKWSYATGGDGWGNNEKQFYTEKRMQNANVENGLLTITAIKENFHGAAYTSARLVSRGKGDWKYGRMEVKARLPKGRGIWPALWMMPTDSKYGDWPASGEIDMMEFVGYLPDSVFATVHTSAYNHSIGTQKGGRTFRKDLSNTFHVYKLDWNENEIKMFVDDELYFTFVNEKKTSREWPFDQRFHFILNVAVGGNWGGTMGIDESIFPQSMQVDYVRVYQK
ncbi:MAG TPA: glycoside hydrolase family 16 protein [Agriterribacter sp.]|nr:glycoside hydrolase family 16 protein [Chitinophagaceae bacterium]HRP32606.1 glycoside hydrolase family 16 protein [Agriterribacter sp.]